MAKRVGDRIGPAAGTDLGVRLTRCRSTVDTATRKFAGDLFVRRSRGDQPQNLQFAGRETVWRGR